MKARELIAQLREKVKDWIVVDLDRAATVALVGVAAIAFLVLVIVVS